MKRTLRTRISNVKSRRGFVLVFSMVVLLILALMTATTMMSNTVSQRVSANYVRTVQVFMVSDAAIQIGHRYLDQYLENLSGSGTPPPYTFTGLLATNSSSSYTYKGANVFFDGTLTDDTSACPKLKQEFYEVCYPPKLASAVPTYSLYLGDNDTFTDGTVNPAEDGDPNTDVDGVVRLIAVAKDPARGTKSEITAHFLAAEGKFQLPKPVATTQIAGPSTAVQFLASNTPPQVNPSPPPPLLYPIREENWRVPLDFDCLPGACDPPAMIVSDTVANNFAMEADIGDLNYFEDQGDMGPPITHLGDPSNQVGNAPIGPAPKLEQLGSQLLAMGIGDKFEQPVIPDGYKLGYRNGGNTDNCKVTVLQGTPNTATGDPDYVDVEPGGDVTGCGLLILHDTMLRVDPTANFRFEGVILVVGDFAGIEWHNRDPEFPSYGYIHYVEQSDPSAMNAAYKEIIFGSNFEFIPSGPALAGAQASLDALTKFAKIVAWHENVY